MLHQFLDAFDMLRERPEFESNLAFGSSALPFLAFTDGCWVHTDSVACDWSLVKTILVQHVFSQDAVPHPTPRTQVG